MSFYFPFTKIADSGESFTAPGAVILAEGQALVRANTTASAGVLPSTGTATDIFVGFSLAGTSAAPFPEAYTNKVEEFTVPSTGNITLSLTPVAGQVFVFDNTTGDAIPTPTVVGSQVTGLTPGDDVSVTYKYAMSVVQATVFQGNIQPGGYSGGYVGQIGVITRGVIYTSEFDASADWSATPSIWLAPNGQITTLANKGANAVQIPGAYVVAIPGQDQPFVGLAFSAA